MGLDITAYRQVVPATDLVLDADGYSEEDGVCALYRNDAFPGRDAGLPAVRYFRYAESTGFRAGSYGGYNGWREWLARLAEYPSEPGDSERHQHSRGAWAADGGPFHELIHFSDCEGTIGPVVSAKLAAEFAEWDDRARAAAGDDAFYYELYDLWRQAFEMAADGGAVEFH